MVHYDMVVIGSGLGEGAPALRAVENGSKAGAMGRASVVPDDAGGERPRVLVLGGGFAGIGAARKLKERRRRRRARRSARLPHLPAVAVPAGDGAARDDGRRTLAPRSRQESGQRHDPQGADHRDRPRGEGSPLRRSRAHHLRLPRLRPRGAGELLRDGWRCRARVSHVHAARRDQAQGPRPRALGGGGQGQRARRRRRADGRRGRRRADRRRDGGSPRRALPVELRHGLSEPPAGEGPRRPRRGRRRDLRDVQAEPARICEGRARAADGRGHDRRSGEVGVADARDALHG